MKLRSKQVLAEHARKFEFSLGNGKRLTLIFLSPLKEYNLRILLRKLCRIVAQLAKLTSISCSIRTFVWIHLH